MSENPAGQADGGTLTDSTGSVVYQPTSSVDVNQLQETLRQANQTIDRLRGTQSSNDRELGRLRTRETELQKSLNDLEASRSAALTDLEAERAAAAGLNQRLGELGESQRLAESAQATVDRLRLAAVMAGTNPAISLLVEANALPQAETLEEFQKSLERIAGGIGNVAASRARDMLSGAHPNVSGEGKPTRETMIAEADRLMREGKLEESIVLHTQALELEQ